MATFWRGNRVDTESDIEPNEETRWIREHIKMRECNLFSRKRDQSNVADPECQCGHSLSEHSQQAILDQVDQVDRWDMNTNTKQRPTNAFGEIKFVGFREKTGKYIRVKVDSEIAHIVELLTDQWKMKKPNLLISVTGGADLFQMNKGLKKKITRGLVKAAQTTGAWIITGGTHSGVMKLVGESVKEVSYGSKNPVVTIGIAPWGCIQNRDQLVNDEGIGRWPANYRLEREQKDNETYLDPNHSHFILCDNGTQHQFAVEIEFRTELEKELAKLKMDTSENAVSVPTVILVLEGGLGTLETVYHALNNNTQAVIVKGSGRVSDILAYAYTYAEEKQRQDSEGNRQERTLSASHEQKVKAMVKREFGKNDIKKHMRRIRGCLKKWELMSIYEYNNPADGSDDIDVTMLKTLLKANQNQEMDQLHLALAWNRIGVAKDEIFTDDTRWSTGSLDDVMTLAIQLHRVDFVELFLDHGVCLKEFLTIERLLTLYNKISETSLLGRLLSEVKKEDSARTKYSLKDVGKLMQELMGDDDYKPNYRTNEKYEVVEPANDLFIWSLLSLQQDMAKLFWFEGKDAIAAALVGNRLLKAMVDKTDDVVLRNKIQKYADEWSQLSIGVLNECYSTNEQMAKGLLVQELTHWGKATCMSIAVKADNKEFISQPACQSQLHNIWMGKMWYKDPFWERIRQLLCVFFPPLACALIKLDEDRNSEKTRQKTEHREDVHDGKPDQSRQEKTDLRKQDSDFINQPLQVNQDKKDKACPPAIEKLYYFFTAPVSIFAYDTLSFIIFLLLFSYILIVTFNPKVTVEETVLIVWVFTFFVETIRQVVSTVSKKHLVYGWIELDFITLGLFITGMVLRSIPSQSTFEAARIVLALSFALFCMRFLQIFSVHKKLGPKIVMIGRMIKDLGYFVLILLVFVISHAVASQSVLFPNSPLAWDTVTAVIRMSYWNIYGELFLEEIEGKPNCTNHDALWMNNTYPRCPTEVGRHFVPILMGVYMLLANVLLLNLLIAMFSYTFKKVQGKTDKHWSYQRYSLIYKYNTRPVFAPPLILLSHIYRLYEFCCCSDRGEDNDFCRKFSNEHELVEWENRIADVFHQKKKLNELDKMESKVDTTSTNLDLLINRLDDNQEAQQDLKKQMAESLDVMIRKLDRIQMQTRNA